MSRHPLAGAPIRLQARLLGCLAPVTDRDDDVIRTLCWSSLHARLGQLNSTAAPWGGSVLTRAHGLILTPLHSNPLIHGSTLPLPPTVPSPSSNITDILPTHCQGGSKTDRHSGSLFGRREQFFFGDGDPGQSDRRIGKIAELGADSDPSPYGCRRLRSMPATAPCSSSRAATSWVARITRSRLGHFAGEREGYLPEGLIGLHEFELPRGVSRSPVRTRPLLLHARLRWRARPLSRGNEPNAGADRGAGACMVGAGRCWPARGARASRQAPSRWPPCPLRRSECGCTD